MGRTFSVPMMCKRGQKPAEMSGEYNFEKKK